MSINIIGSPAIVVTLFKNDMITKNKALDCVYALETTGWFDTEVINKMRQQIEKR